MKTWYRQAKEPLVHPDGKSLLIKKDEWVLTSDVIDNEVWVFSLYWYKLPLSFFREIRIEAYGHEKESKSLH